MVNWAVKFLTVIGCLSLAAFIVILIATIGKMVLDDLFDSSPATRQTAAATDASSAKDTPEVIDSVTGIKVQPGDAGLTDLLVMMNAEPTDPSAGQKMITVSVANTNCRYFADVPADQPARVIVTGHGSCAEYGQCSATSVAVHLHSYTELH